MYPSSNADNSNWRSLLRTLSNGRVRRIGLLVWPDSAALADTDVQLLLEMVCADGVTREVVCSTSPDGQTPQVNHEKWPTGNSIAELDQKRALRTEHEASDDPRCRGYQLFETGNGEMFGIRPGDLLVGIKVIQFCDAGHEPTGLIFEFAGGNVIVSAPSAYGNSVRRTVDEFLWPSAVEFVPIP